MLTEAQIEAIAEAQMTRLDRFFLAGRISQTDYDREVKRIAEETEKAHAIRLKPSRYEPSNARAFTSWTREGRFG